MAIDPDIELARIVAVDLQPVDEFGIGGPAEPRQQRFPSRDQVDPPGQRVARAFDACTALPIQPVGRVLDDRFEPSGKLSKGVRMAASACAAVPAASTSSPGSCAVSVSMP